MDIETLRKNFNDQLATAEKQINDLRENLKKAEEYKTKLLGGLETLELLEGQSEEAEELPTE